jgi:hypothetical protein
MKDRCFECGHEGNEHYGFCVGGAVQDAEATYRAALKMAREALVSSAHCCRERQTAPQSAWCVQCQQEQDALARIDGVLKP